jgi:hypothetical protein
MTCETYPDLYHTIPGASASPDELANAYTDNQRSLRLAYAVQQVLQTSFKLGWDFKEQFLRNADLPVAKDKVDPTDPAVQQRVFLFSVLGLLLADNITDPSFGTQAVSGFIPAVDPDKRRITLLPPPSIDGEAAAQVVERQFMVLDEATLKGQERKQPVKIVRRFIDSVVDAVKEYQDSSDLFAQVFLHLREEGANADGTRYVIYPRQLAEVTRNLVQRGVSPDDPQLQRQIGDALSVALGGAVDAQPAAVDVDIFDLDLDGGSSADIVAQNLFALGGIYFAAQLEDMKFFAVADKVAEQFMNGQIPVSRGPGGGRIYKYHRDAVNRMTEHDRRGLYARSFGLAQGSVDEAMPNREFSDLWLRFLSATSLFNRQSQYERTLITGQQLYKNARDLAVNLSFHGYALAHFAAVEVQQQIRDIYTMLSDADILAAYGTRDVWQLVDRVAGVYLGGAVNGVRNRTLAQSGGRIIKWLGDHAPMLSTAFTRGVELEFGRGTLPDDVERWLAVNGVTDTTVSQFAEPVAVAQQPTIPTLGFNGFDGGTPALNDALNAVNSIAARPAMPQPALATP